jgi:hypothetical protein
MMQEAQGLSMDLSTIQLNLTLLFDLDTAPRSSRELRQRMAEIRRLTWTVYVDALRAQTLMQTTVSALRHMVRLIEAIGDFLGNNQGKLLSLNFSQFVEVQNGPRISQIHPSWPCWQ